MPRRIQWGLALLVVLGFVAPGTSRAGAAGTTQSGPAGSRHRVSLVNTARSDYAPIAVRQGVDFDDARNDRAGGLKRSFVGTATVRASASPRSARAHCRAARDIVRSSSVSNVARRAPPSASA